MLRWWRTALQRSSSARKSAPSSCVSCSCRCSHAVHHMEAPAVEPGGTGYVDSARCRRERCIIILFSTLAGIHACNPGPGRWRTLAIEDGSCPAPAGSLAIRWPPLLIPSRSIDQSLSTRAISPCVRSVLSSADYARPRSHYSSPRHPHLNSANNNDRQLRGVGRDTSISENRAPNRPPTPILVLSESWIRHPDPFSPSRS